MRKHKERVLYDERILGNNDFVERILKEADEGVKYQLPANELRKVMKKLIEEGCRRENINIKELRLGSRRRPVSRVRAWMACQLVEDHGVPLAEVARQLGISTSAISKALERKTEKFNKLKIVP